MLPCLSKSFGLSEEPNKNLRGCGEDHFWELDRWGLNFSGWSCWLFAENNTVLELCFIFCSVWELFKINAQFSPSQPLLMWLAMIGTTLFLVIDFPVCNKAGYLHTDTAF